MPVIDTMFSMRASASRGVFAWTVVKRAVVTGVHRLQHVERFAATHFADDDAVGAHAQALRTRSRCVTGAAAFDVRRTRFQSHDMRLLQLQLGGVLDRDDALGLRE